MYNTFNTNSTLVKIVNRVQGTNEAEGLVKPFRYHVHLVELLSVLPLLVLCESYLDYDELHPTHTVFIENRKSF